MQIYREQCASCHGLKQPSKFGPTMFPRAPQLWERHKNKPDVVGVSDDPVGETYWKIKNGIRLSGMPSYKTLLTEDQMWLTSRFHSTPPNYSSHRSLNSRQPGSNRDCTTAPRLKAAYLRFVCGNALHKCNPASFTGTQIVQKGRAAAPARGTREAK